MFRLAGGLCVYEIPQVLQRRALVIVSAIFILLAHLPEFAFDRSPTLRRFAPLQLLGHLIQKSGVHENENARAEARVKLETLCSRRAPWARRIVKFARQVDQINHNSRACHYR